MNIAISGSSGFVGNKLIKVLEKGGASNIVKIDKFLNYDLTKWSDIENIKNIDVFVHLASYSFVPDSYENPRLFFDNNYNSTLNALELARLNKAKFIFISSYVYGHPKYLPIDEKHPVEDFNPYCSSKLLCEELCRSYNTHFDLKVSILRPFNFYGIGQNDKFLIPLILNQAKKGMIQLNDPRPKRDLLYIDDAVDAISRLINYDTKSFDIFNLGSGISYSINEIVEIICKLYNKRIPLNYLNIERKNEILETKADIRKISDELGWFPKISLEEGLRKILEGNK